MEHGCEIAAARMCCADMQREYPLGPAVGLCAAPEAVQRIYSRAQQPKRRFYAYAGREICAEARAAACRHVCAALPCGAVMRGWASRGKWRPLALQRWRAPRHFQNRAHRRKIQHMPPPARRLCICCPACGIMFLIGGHRQRAGRTERTFHARAWAEGAVQVCRKNRRRPLP